MPEIRDLSHRTKAIDNDTFICYVTNVSVECSEEKNGGISRIYAVNYGTPSPRNLGTPREGTMEITDEIWVCIRRLFWEAFESSFHYTFATVGGDGMPRATPIGSLILGSDRKGFYFEEYSSGLSQNLRTNKRVCVLAVNTNKRLWFKMLLFGEFTETCAVRLMGTAGEKRLATNEEIELFRNRVSSYRMLKGHDLLWGNLTQVRDITFDSFEPVRIGPFRDLSTMGVR